MFPKQKEPKVRNARRGHISSESGLEVGDVALQANCLHLQSIVKLKELAKTCRLFRRPPAHSRADL